ncbi:arsenate reductase ArsC [Methylobacillus flagellatus]|uniref:arsenate reductase ArsC n=1 Tax=Methylobacillus flagellatus TaxID=405 RepID=UPI0028540363|nr:arsenate reductase ArsC [Methylobacillus flagellatus]MDR5170398.1 arsenate reductase ArsC [Methylobacillus flagellatus]
MTIKAFNVLILCTGNSARSIMAEALFNKLGQGRFKAYSAGSNPTGKVNPFAIEQIADLGYSTEELRSKSWDEFAKPEAPRMDIVITVCDNAAGEACPIWPGTPVSGHWGFEDPAAIEGSDEDKRIAFSRIRRQIQHCVERFISLPVEAMSASDIKHLLDSIK